MDRLRSIAGAVTYQWLAAFLFIVATAVHGPADAQADHEPDRRSIERRIDGIRAWLTTARPSKLSGSLPNGATRTIPFHKNPEGRIVEADTPNALQLTAACKSLEFLAQYADYYGLEGSSRKELAQFVGYLQGLRSTRPEAVHYGALANDGSRRSYVTFSNAICGKALLLGYKILGDREWLEMAVQIGDYLLRLIEMGDALTRSYSAATGGGQAEYGIFDRATAEGRIQVTSTTWNIVAAVLLRDLSTATGVERYSAAARRIVAFQVHGIERGYDYFSPLLHRRHDDLITRWNLGYSSVNSALKHDFSDGKWHRHGDIRVPGTGTVGTDQIEYGLQALFNLGWDGEGLRRLYLKYQRLPNAVSCLDSGISFSGYFRIFDDSEGAPSVAYGAYYDIVGAGILAELKRAFFPGDYAKSIRVMLENHGDWTMIDCQFQPVWSARRDNIMISRRSTLVSATTGIALLHRLRTLDRDARTAPR